MPESPHLALAYIDKSPESAGRTLSSMPVDACAAFIEEIPTPQAVRLIAHLRPALAARIVQSLDHNVAATIFRDLDFGKSSAVVRQMDRASRKQFLARLSRRTRAALERSLSFAPGTAGAHMTTSIVTLSQTDTVATAIETVRHSVGGPLDIVFVVSDAGHFAGVVRSAIALRHPEGTLLSALLDTSCSPVSAHSKLEAITDPVIWNDFAHLPVINRRHEVIGAISRLALSTARNIDPAEDFRDGQSMSASLLAALSTTSSGLLDIVSQSLSASVRPGRTR